MTTSVVTQAPPLSGLHLLMTYECNYECDHCFVWGGPASGGTMTEQNIEHILEQAKALGTIKWIYFEGGEPSLFYDLLCFGVRMASESGFNVGIVTNASWASNKTDAMAWLIPFADRVGDLSISDDAYHASNEGLQQTHIARQAAKQLGIPVDFISVTGPEAAATQITNNQTPIDEFSVQFRGRAAENLTAHVQRTSWNQYTECPWEELRHPERLHVDAYGNLHVCQGISIGNLFEKTLTEIMASYAPDNHPVIGPLLKGGPAELINRYELTHKKTYADACHLCYSARCKLRESFPEVLAPNQMYGNN